MRRVFTLLMALSLSFVLFACGQAEKAMEAAKVAKDLKNKGTLELMNEAAEDQYEAPTDGRLTEKQIQMYLKVRDHEKQIVQVAKKEAEAHAKKAEGKEKSLAGMMEGLKTLGSVADMLTADIRAAKDLGYNTAEYQWVKEKVLEASGAAMGEQFSQSMSAMFDSQIEAFRQQLAEAKDDASKQYLQEALQQAEKAREEMKAQQEPQDPTVAYNKQLLSKYETALNAIAHEFSKFEDKPGDTEKAVAEWQKQTEAAATQPQQNQ